MTIEEQRAAYLVGVRRARTARARGGKHLVGWRMDISEDEANGYSAVAEALVAEDVGGEWISQGTTPDDPDDGDVVGPDGTRYGVRWTPRTYGGLILREKDPDHLVAVLVVGLPPTLDVVGSIGIKDAKVDTFWRYDWNPGAWLIPPVFVTPLPILVT